MVLAQLRQYAAKYDPNLPGMDSTRVDQALDQAAGRLFDSHSPGAYKTWGYGAATEPQIFSGSRSREGVCC